MAALTATDQVVMFNLWLRYDPESSIPDPLESAVSDGECMSLTAILIGRQLTV